MKTFGERIYKMRIEKKLKVADLAKKIGISIQAWTDYEKDRSLPQVEKLIAISKFFGVSVDYLLFGYKTEFDPPTIDEMYSSYLGCLNELIRVGLLIPRENISIRDKIVFESNDDFVKMFVISYLKLKQCASQYFDDNEIHDMSKVFCEKFKIKI